MIAPRLDITQTINGRRQWMQSFQVTGKREARQIAQANNAIPWNF